ncbi:UNVERIFIED_CONTAM: hypothetical protein FKN15_011643 [Acipenser sinensis]
MCLLLGKGPNPTEGLAPQLPDPVNMSWEGRHAEILLYLPHNQDCPETAGAQVPCSGARALIPVSMPEEVSQGQSVNSPASVITRASQASQLPILSIPRSVDGLTNY